MHPNKTSELIHIHRKAPITSPTARFQRLNTLVGEGSFKKVFLAFDSQSGSQVAWSDVSTDTAQKAYMVSNEVNIFKSIQSPHIISYFNSWFHKEGSRAHIITELMTGGTLRQYLSNISAVSGTVIRRWALQILRGIHHLHTRPGGPVVHRDLKCDNIFVDAHAANVKIGDLGLACKLRAGAENGLRGTFGTPGFMSPEALSCSYNQKTDIYSYAMLLVEMVTGEYPHGECRTQAEVYAKTKSYVLPQALSRFPAGLADLRDLIESCIVPSKIRPSAADLLKHPVFKGIDATRCAGGSPAMDHGPADHGVSSGSSSSAAPTSFGQSPDPSALYRRMRKEESSARTCPTNSSGRFKVSTQPAPFARTVQPISPPPGAAPPRQPSPQHQLRQHPQPRKLLQQKVVQPKRRDHLALQKRHESLVPVGQQSPGPAAKTPVTSLCSPFQIPSSNPQQQHRHAANHTFDNAQGGSLRSSTMPHITLPSALLDHRKCSTPMGKNADVRAGSRKVGQPKERPPAQGCMAGNGFDGVASEASTTVTAVTQPGGSPCDRTITTPDSSPPPASSDVDKSSHVVGAGTNMVTAQVAQREHQQHQAAAQVRDGAEERPDAAAGRGNDAMVTKQSKARAPQKLVTSTPTPKRKLTFEWSHTKAQHVFLAGSFDGWAVHHRMRKDRDAFSIQVELDVGRRYQYKFVVDNNWYYDITKETGEDGNGNVNNVVVVVDDVDGR